MAINTTLTRLREGIETPFITNFTMLFVPFMPTSCYITTCFGGGHHHHHHQRERERERGGGIYLVMHT
jgi:hypothetical protein